MSGALKCLTGLAAVMIIVGQTMLLVGEGQAGKARVDAERTTLMCFDKAGVPTSIMGLVPGGECRQVIFRNAN